MFWRFGGYANISTIDTLLEKPDTTLEDVLDESDLIQELKQHNTKLIEFLRDENALRKLLNYVIAPAPFANDDAEEQDDGQTATGEKGKAKKANKMSQDDFVDEEQDKAEKTAMKYSYVACEVLSSETWSILESLMENKEHLQEFWSYLRRSSPLDGLQAGYFTKVNETLFEKKTEDMIEFFKTLDGIVPAMLQHVDCPMVMDLLLKIISLEKQDGGQGIVDWLVSQDLIPNLLSFLSPDCPASTQTSAGDFLKAIITISANASQTDGQCIGPNSLTRQLVSETCMQSLISSMLKGGNPLTVGVGIVIEVIRKNNSDYDPESGHNPDVAPTTHDPIYLGTLLRMFAQHVPDFMELILSSRHTVTEGEQTRIEDRGHLVSAWGTTIEPLGFDRFKTCELMAELLHCSNMGLINERGSQAFIHQRDVERERLKAAGAFAPHKPEDSIVEATDDSTIAARLMLSTSESPEESRVVNTSEDDGFEKVTAEIPNEGENSSEEKIASEDSSIAEPFTEIPSQPKLEVNDDFVEEPLSSPRIEALTDADFTPKSEIDITSESSGSPDTSHIEQEVRRVSLDDTAMRTPPNEEDDLPNFHDEYSSPPLEQSEYREATALNLSPHPEDKPAPLFSKGDPNKTPTPQSPNALGGQNGSTNAAAADQGNTSQDNSLPNEDSQYEPRAIIDIDGKPVVGDYLKIQFVESKVVPTILSFFFRFPWNNFLHNVVYDVIQQVFNGPMDRGFNRSLAIDLFETGSITDQIVEGQRRSDEAQEKRFLRLGYMGHLTLVAEEVVKFSERHPPELLSQNVMEKVLNRQWIDYVEQTLSETRERDNAILGGVRPDMSVGPRQAVLNAVNAAQGLGGSAVGGLDSIDLSNNGSASSGVFSGSGSLLSSGFGSSSDDDDEEMEEADELMDEETRRAQLLAADAGPGVVAANSENSPDIPVPLLPPPPAANSTNSAPRARRQFAARLALHKQQAADAAASANANADGADEEATSSAEDPFAALDGQPSKRKRARRFGGIGELFSAGGGHKRSKSGFDEDDEEDGDEDEDDDSDNDTDSDEDEDGEGRAILEATRSRERKPLEVDDEDEWGDFAGAGPTTGLAEENGAGGNSSDEGEPGGKEGPDDKAHISPQTSDPEKASPKESTSIAAAASIEEDDDSANDSSDGDGLVEIALPSKKASANT